MEGFAYVILGLILSAAIIAFFIHIIRWVLKIDVRTELLKNIHQELINIRQGQKPATDPKGKPI